MKDKVLVDTSVWIEFFRGGNDPVSASLKQLLVRNSTAVSGIVVTELYRGAKGERELRFLMKFLEAVDYIKTDEEVYNKAGSMGYNLSKQGIHIGTVDLIIAQTALEHRMSLYSLDRHFERIAEHYPLKLFQ